MNAEESIYKNTSAELNEIRILDDIQIIYNNVNQSKISIDNIQDASEISILNDNIIIDKTTYNKSNVNDTLSIHNSGIHSKNNISYKAIKSPETIKQSLTKKSSTILKVLKKITKILPLRNSKQGEIHTNYLHKRTPSIDTIGERKLMQIKIEENRSNRKLSLVRKKIKCYRSTDNDKIKKKKIEKYNLKIDNIYDGNQPMNAEESIYKNTSTELNEIRILDDIKIIYNNVNQSKISIDNIQDASEISILNDNIIIDKTTYNKSNVNDTLSIHNSGIHSKNNISYKSIKSPEIIKQSLTTKSSTILKVLTTFTKILLLRNSKQGEIHTNYLHKITPSINTFTKILLLRNSKQGEIHTNYLHKRTPSIATIGERKLMQIKIEENRSNRKLSLVRKKIKCYRSTDNDKIKKKKIEKYNLKIDNIYDGNQPMNAEESIYKNTSTELNEIRILDDIKIIYNNVNQSKISIDNIQDASEISILNDNIIIDKTTYNKSNVNDTLSIHNSGIHSKNNISYKAIKSPENIKQSLTKKSSTILKVLKKFTKILPLRNSKQGEIHTNYLHKRTPSIDTIGERKLMQIKIEENRSNRKLSLVRKKIKYYRSTDNDKIKKKKIEKYNLKIDNIYNGNQPMNAEESIYKNTSAELNEIRILDDIQIIYNNVNQSKISIDNIQDASEISILNDNIIIDKTTYNKSNVNDTLSIHNSGIHSKNNISYKAIKSPETIKQSLTKKSSTILKVLKKITKILPLRNSKQGEIHTNYLHKRTPSIDTIGERKLMQIKIEENRSNRKLSLVRKKIKCYRSTDNDKIKKKKIEKYNLKIDNIYDGNQPMNAEESIYKNTSTELNEIRILDDIKIIYNNVNQSKISIDNIQDASEISILNDNIIIDKTTYNKSNVNDTLSIHNSGIHSKNNISYKSIKSPEIIKQSLTTKSSTILKVLTTFTKILLLRNSKQGEIHTNYLHKITPSINTFTKILLLRNSKQGEIHTNYLHKRTPSIATIGERKLMQIKIEENRSNRKLSLVRKKIKCYRSTDNDKIKKKKIEKYNLKIDNIYDGNQPMNAEESIYKNTSTELNEIRILDDIKIIYNNVNQSKISIDNIQDASEISILNDNIIIDKTTYNKSNVNDTLSIHNSGIHSKNNISYKSIKSPETIKQSLTKKSSTILKVLTTFTKILPLRNSKHGEIHTNYLHKRTPSIDTIGERKLMQIKIEENLPNRKVSLVRKKIKCYRSTDNDKIKKKKLEKYNLKIDYIYDGNQPMNAEESIYKNTSTELNEIRILDDIKIIYNNVNQSKISIDNIQDASEISILNDNIIIDKTTYNKSNVNDTLSIHNSGIHSKNNISCKSIKSPEIIKQSLTTKSSTILKVLTTFTKILLLRNSKQGEIHTNYLHKITPSINTFTKILLLRNSKQGEIHTNYLHKITPSINTIGERKLMQIKIEENRHNRKLSQVRKKMKCYRITDNDKIKKKKLEKYNRKIGKNYDGNHLMKKEHIRTNLISEESQPSRKSSFVKKKMKCYFRAESDNIKNQKIYNYNIKTGQNYGVYQPIFITKDTVINDSIKTHKRKNNILLKLRNSNQNDIHLNSPHKITQPIDSIGTSRKLQNIYERKSVIEILQEIKDSKIYKTYT